jgi:bifunctional DNase/RNase
MIEMTVDSVRISVVDYQRVVVLKEKEAERYLLIWVGSSEAGSIAMALQGIIPPRPLSHDLMQALMGKLGITVAQVLINSLVDDTFFAQITLESASDNFQLDSRPSDAIALALRVKAPIFAELAVLEKAGIVPQTGEDGKPDEDKLSIFRDFINTLDLTGLTDTGQEHA